MNNKDYKELIDQGGVLRIIIYDQLGNNPKGCLFTPLSFTLVTAHMGSVYICTTLFNIMEYTYIFLHRSIYLALSTLNSLVVRRGGRVSFLFLFGLNCIAIFNLV